MSGPRCWPLPLPAAELAEWIALRRVRGGGVASFSGWWLDFGRPVPCYLDDPLDDVVRVGLVVLVEDAAHCLSRAVLTEDGSARYHTLCERRGIPLTARDPVSSGLPTGIPPRWSGPGPVPSPPGIRRRHGATPGKAAS